MMGTTIRSFAPLPYDISLEDLVPDDNFYRRLEAQFAGTRVPRTARDDRVPTRQGSWCDAPRVYEIVRCERAVSADTALRLGRFFGTGPEFWINLQSHHDLEVARDRAGEKIERQITPLSPV